ncbi:hypothetical protein OG689_01015 [Kitasatospora sp. NBC_00240]|uniref:hypothetical protein n=1 Tax=Kitasatospora sp. NBC_00240 TaxID=2903567 RepID=UPI00224EA42D|nr:hypothetical protein [Kitasatospora sp. NBC_00240]MCX5207913.1 hypothetical protein [Kitasatospora sp. NBC_00240]
MTPARPRPEGPRPTVPRALRRSFRLWLLIVLAGALGVAVAFAERVRIGVEPGDFVLLAAAAAGLAVLVALARAARAGRRRARALLTVLTAGGLALAAVAVVLTGDSPAGAVPVAALVVAPVTGQLLMYLPAARAHFRSTDRR